ncbi:rhamnosyltransferase WsaF family glycosyltransferase [Novosphingobium soli]|uniref:Glycosyltransferase n=1 Tax=Novosphingobium soli TaxID=574956 RepID=A0ABV6CRS9_9SPHN
MNDTEFTCDVLFLIGCWEGESKRYRVHNIAEGLEFWGYRTEVMDFSHCGEIVDKGLRPRVVVFFRAPFDPSKRLVEVLEYCRVHRIRTVYDVDDYVFEPAIVDTVAGVAELTAAQRADYEWGVRAYRSLLFSCERATTTTPLLRDKMVELGRDAHIVPNTFNAAQRELADRLLSVSAEKDDKVRICYFSGSKTHSRDFAQCASAIQAVMRRHPKVVFRLVGLLDLDDSWVPFAERIERAGFMPALDMLRSLSECDINLAPLEEGDLFSEGKSELKFFEAALVEVPTVASRTAPFRAAIADGEVGYLASTPEEWEDKLGRLASDASLRQSMGAAARRSAMAAFSAEKAARKALVAYGLETPAPVRIRNEGSLKIGWIVPGLIIGGGGHRNILRAAYHLERFGHDVRLYFSDTDMTETQLRKAVREHFYPFEGPVRRFTGRVDEEDVLMATHWSTVALAESVRSLIGEIMYFVQDFEPAFYPMGSEYILAENTYRKNLYAVTSGPWCAHILRRDYAMEADSFRFPVDGGIYNAAAGNGEARAKRVLFFAKPEMARRCFLIGTMALREFHRLKPDYEILFFGSGSAKQHPQEYPVTYLDIVPTLNDLARLYATSAAGLVFSTTNPSLVPYEMMACGLPVIDLDRPGNEVNYDNRRDIALLADADPVRMASDMAAMLDDAEALALRSANGVDFAATFPSEEEMARRVEKLIVERIARTRSRSHARPLALA